MDHAARLERLRDRLEQPLLVTNLSNIRYLTGFDGSAAFLFVSGDDTVFVTDGRYAEVADSLVMALPETRLVIHTGSVHDTLADAMKGRARVALEAPHVTWATVRALQHRFDGELVPSQGVVEEQRRHKDAAEIEALRAAAAAGDAAFAEVRQMAADAATESDLGWLLRDAMRRRGAGIAGWEPIVAAGPNAARPHHRAGPAPLGTGLLLLDYGCVVDGYHSDMSRTIWLSGETDPETVRLHRAVLEAQEAGIAAIRPGVSGRDVDAVCRDVLHDHGLAEHFLHSTGHGVGLDIHENPRLSRLSDDVLEVGDVVTVEPGVYLPGVGGVRIEDMVHVTADGAEVLTHSPKEMT